MVSLKDISKKCGVSIATVSKAINNHNDVSQKTKDMINKVAKEMGYFPNSQARALKTNRTYNLGVLFVDLADRGLTHEFFSLVLNSFKCSAEERGYDITFINKNISGKKMSYYEHCKYRNVDGVLVACVDFKDPDVYELANSDIPLVTVDHVFDNRSAVLSDNRQGIRELFDYVYSMGHRKIAYINGDKSSVADNRMVGFFKALSDYNIPVQDDYILNSEYLNPELTEKLTTQLLSLPNPPTCIFMPDDFSAIGGYNAVKNLGLTVGKDISIVGYDGMRISQFLSPTLTTYKQDADSIGRQATNQLIALIEKPNVTFNEVINVRGQLVINNSVAKINSF